MRDVLKYLSICLIIFAVGGVIGYFIGKSGQDVVTKTERIYTWSKGKEVTKEIFVPQPYAVHDTVDRVILQTIDTAALYATWLDYHKTRDYALDFSDDSLGVFKVDFSVSENKVCNSPKATIQPNVLTITETNTVYKVPIIQGYVMVGTSIDLGTNQIQAGIDLKQKFLVGASGIRMNNNWGYTINLGIKF